MRILADENIPRMTVEALQKLGHDVRDVRGTPDRGIPDTALWKVACDERGPLITTDKGFTQYRSQARHAVLIVRLRQPNRHKIHMRVMQAIAQFASDKWPGQLVVMRDAIQSVSRATP